MMRIFLLLVLLTTPSLATTLTFSGTGHVAPSGPPDASGNLPLVVMQSTTAYAVSDGRTWHLDTAFSFNVFTLTGAGAFLFTSGLDALAGTFLTVESVPDLFTLTYSVTGGSGVHAGYAGQGSSTVTLLGDRNQPPTPFFEEGSFTVVPTPEPGSYWLLLIGLSAVLSLANFQLHGPRH